MPELSNENANNVCVVGVNGKPFMLYNIRDATHEAITEAIEARTGIPKHLQVLTANGRVSTSGRFKLENDACIHLSVKGVGGGGGGGTTTGISTCRFCSKIF